MHWIKFQFQSAVAPNGLVASLFGPVEGRRHDSAMLVDSGLLQELSQYSFSLDGVSLCVYGDPTYPLRVHIQGPFKGVNLTPAEQQFNKAMSQVRVSVEWLFWDIVNYFAFLDFKKKFKIGIKSCWQNVHCVCALKKRSQLSLSIKYLEVFWNISTPNPGLFQLGF